MFWGAFWVDCSSEATTRADFKSIGNLCGWPPNDLDFFCGAKDQLASSDQHLLLILDNCDDPKTNFSHYIPSNPQVSVLLTTRLSDAGKYASLDTQDTRQRLYLRMDGIDPASATRLILEASGVPSEDDVTVQQAKQIADALDYHPLAIVVASSLMQNSTYSLKEYAEALKDRLTQRELLDTESEQATHRKVSTTFEISASVLRDLAASESSAQEALELLDLLGFMHYQGISDDMFVRAWEFEDVTLSNSTSQDRWPPKLSVWHVAQARKYFPHATIDERKRKFRKARAHLIRLTLVKQNSEDNTTYMHSLVHLWARERLQNPTNPWAAAASILALAAQGSHGWQPYSTQLSLHCEANFRFREHSSCIRLKGEGEAICRIYCNFAWQMIFSHHAQALDIVKAFLGEVQSLPSTEVDDLLVTEPRHMLGLLFLRGGDFSQAIHVLEEVMRMRAKLADDHSYRLSSQHELACAYLEDGRIPQAIGILEHVVRRRNKLRSSDRISSQHALARAYVEDGRISRASEILEHVVQANKKLAADHPDRLLSQHELAASAYLKARRFSQAIAILEDVVLANYKLPAEHPDRLASLHELASAYLKAGRYFEAIRILEDVVLANYKLPADHPDRLASWHELVVSAYLEARRLSQAIEDL